MITYRESPIKPTAHQTLLKEAHPTWAPDHRRRVIRSFAQSDLVVSAWDEKQLIGTGRIVSDGVAFGLLVDLLVHPSYRHQGIASTLITMGRKLRPELILYADPAGPELEPLYVKNGFTLHPVWRSKAQS